MASVHASREEGARRAFRDPGVARMAMGAVPTLLLLCAPGTTAGCAWPGSAVATGAKRRSSPSPSKPSALASILSPLPYTRVPVTSTRNLCRHSLSLSPTNIASQGVQDRMACGHALGVQNNTTVLVTVPEKPAQDDYPSIYLHGELQVHALRHDGRGIMHQAACALHSIYESPAYADTMC